MHRECGCRFLVFFFFYTLLEAHRWSFVLHSFFGACRFKSCPAGSLSPLNDMLLNFGELDEHVWEGDDDGDEDEEEEGDGEEGKTVQPLLKICFFIKKRSHIGQALPACLPACRFFYPQLWRRRPGWKQQADAHSLRCVCVDIQPRGFGKLMRKRGDYSPFVNGATSVFRFLVWNDTLW